MCLPDCLPDDLCASQQEARLQEEEARQRLRIALAELDETKRRVASIQGCLKVNHSNEVIEQRLSAYGYFAFTFCRPRFFR